MIGTIRKHSTWLWVIIIAVVIITFVFWGSQSSRFGNAPGNINLGTIHGQPVTREDYANARREVYLHFFFRYRDWPDKAGKQFGFDEDRETYQRLLLIQEMDKLGIRVSEEAAASIASRMLRSLNGGNPLPADVFAAQVLRPRGMSLGDFQRYVQHELGVQQLMLLTGLGGSLVTPHEARAIYEREHQELSAQAVFFSASNFLSNVTAAPESVSQFYSNYMASYRLPERVEVSYVKFNASNYVAEATQQFSEITNLNEIVEAQYERLGTNYFLEAKTPEEKKEKIREEMFKNQLLVNARRAANEFATVLMDREPWRAGDLEVLAQERGINVRVSQPFDERDGPKELDVGADFIKAAFGLTPEEPFGGPIVASDGVYVMAYHKKLPSENPPFQSVRDQVIQDFKFAQAVQLARKAGDDFHTALTNGLGAGKGFAAICVEARVKPLLPLPFSLSTRALPEVESHASLYQFKQAAFTTPPGQASDFMRTRDGGFVVFVQSKFPMDEAKLTAELPRFLSVLRQNRQAEAFNMWVNLEAQRDPGFRQIMEQLAKRNQPPAVSGTP